MDSNVLLSIIIPTYNGGEYIDDNLSELISQYQSLHGKNVEIIISNNASEDNTDEIVQKYLGVCPQIKYIKRETNIGAMANFTESVIEAKGDFVFLLGDDDIICPQFINIIVSILKDNPSLGLLHWNRIDYKMRDLRSTIYNQDMRLPVFEKYDNFTLFVKEHATMDSMSTVLFKKTVWFEGEQYISEHHYGYLWYSRILNGAANKQCYYSYYPLIIQRHPAQRKWMTKQPLYTCGLLNIYKDLDERAPGVYDWVKSHYIMLSRENYLNEMLIVAGNRKWYKPYYEEIRFHFNKEQRVVFYTIMYLLPSFVSKALLSLVKLFVVLNRRFRS